ncbi:hypothetical protein KUTeg_005900 [Tegillarca granosa]|uniref:Cadherin domain-containing protein n=1 Tax=Tegillarca granosa TaxID=220873 RepID=A0ABQ9FGZ9_TEGGR|nr:hypothetical protein KUTeg_005900 [Tegillarca granosa]
MLPCQMVQDVVHHRVPLLLLMYCATINTIFFSEPYSRLITETVLQGTTLNIFNQVRYEVIGDGNAPSFFEVNAVTGSISLRQTLTSQADTVYSLRIRAYDNGIPAKSNTSVVTLTVNRPRFTQTSWGANVPDNQPLGETIITVTATDADTGCKLFLRSIEFTCN